MYTAIYWNPVTPGGLYQARHHRCHFQCIDILLRQRTKCPAISSLSRAAENSAPLAAPDNTVRHLSSCQSGAHLINSLPR